jgi:formylglycine-generating enzyme required for sulfatase activity
VDESLVVQPDSWLGSWKILHQVGSGSSSHVFKAESDQGVIGAAKVLRASLRSDAEKVAAFRKEAEERRINYHDVLDIADGYYIMRFYEGITFRLHLEHEHQKSGRYLGRECFEIFWQITNELAKRHSKQPPTIVRDLKFDNIILAARHGGWDATLIDSGSEINALRKEPSATAGTAIYEAPECYEDGARYPITCMADMYSFGIMLWEAITGSPPFVAGSSTEVRELHLVGDLKPALLYHHGCPDELAALIMECLDCDPNRRPSARKMSDALRKLMGVDESAADREYRVAPKHVELPSASPLSETRRRLLYLAATAIVLGTVAAASLSHLRAATMVSGAAPASAPTRAAAPAGVAGHALSPEDIKAECAPFAGTEYVCVPAGKFVMGLTREQIVALCDRLGKDCTRDPKGVLEKLMRSLPEGGAPRQVLLSTFAMMRTPVTCAEFAAFLNQVRQLKRFGVDLEDRPYAPPDGQPVRRPRYPTLDGKRIYDLFTDHACITMDPLTEVFSANPKTSQHAVELVSWYGADAYCTRQQATLPTEAQFGYVRGYAKGLYPWGTPVDATCKEVAYGQFPDEEVTPVQHGECESIDDSQKGPRDVGTSPLDTVPGLNIKDLGGNVREWAKDGFIERLKPCDGGLCIDPVVPAQPAGHYAMSGGSYALSRWFMLSGFRGQHDGDSLEYGAGLRCVKNTTMGGSL